MILIGDSSDLQAGWIAGDSGAVKDFCLFGGKYNFGNCPEFYKLTKQMRNISPGDPPFHREKINPNQN